MRRFIGVLLVTMVVMATLIDDSEGFLWGRRRSTQSLSGPEEVEASDMGLMVDVGKSAHRRRRSSTRRRRSSKSRRRSSALFTASGLEDDADMGSAMGEKEAKSLLEGLLFDHYAEAEPEPVILSEED